MDDRNLGIILTKCNKNKFYSETINHFLTAFQLSGQYIDAYLRLYNNLKEFNKLQESILLPLCHMIVMFTSLFFLYSSVKFLGKITTVIFYFLVNL